MKPFSFRSPVFWVVLFTLSVLGGGWAYRFYPEAFPLVSLELSMDRALALEAARTLAQEQTWVPESYRASASFGVESRTRAFVELEAGGAARFRELMEVGPYSPYTWNVRLFQPGEALEARLRFRPDGSPYAFHLAVPEDRPGSDLDVEAARAIAEAACSSPWRIDLSEWTAIETASELLPAGRRDHVFVYRHRDFDLGSGELRLRLEVRGDRLTELSPFVWLPDAFDRRYEEMRSANRAVSGAASFAMAVLYLLGGCLAGLFWLARERGIEAKPAWIWGFAFAGLGVLSNINQWPLLWMAYDTALSPIHHALWEALGLFLQLIGLGVLFTLTFMAAEGLGRKAFPDHHQFWKSWSSGVANSPDLLGQTVGGYLLVAIFFAYEVALYVLAHRHLGWWTPSDSLLHPDVLASYLPWFSSIVLSAQAGFWEECLFRAVPIAGAALLGKRYGHRRLFIVLALVLQALIFGAAHANYATQPAWARLTELVLPALGFGLLYLRFGLVPAIVLHYAFDVVWFATPLFVSDAAGLWDDRLLVLLSTFLPLGIVIYRRLRVGRWQAIGREFRNRAWLAPPLPAPREPRRAPERPLLRKRHQQIVFVCGALSLFAWALTFESPSDAPRLDVDRAVARAQASDALRDRGIELTGESWRVLPYPVGEPNQSHRFVWDEAGKGIYDELLGSYLALPGWHVRWARFDGDLTARSEEALVVLGPAGEVRRVVHLLPESRTGASLGEQEAAAIARQAAQSLLGVDVRSLDEVAFSSEQLPDRRDWLITWSDASVPLGEGRAEVVVEIAGDEVVDAHRRIAVPDSWKREHRERRSLTTALEVIAWLGFTLVVVAGVLYGIVHWSRLAVSLRELSLWAAVLAALGMIELLSSWPIMTASLSTAQNPWLQITMAFGSGLLVLLVTAGSMGLLAGIQRSWWPSSALSSASRSMLALAGGALAAAALGGASLWAEPATPSWPSIENAGQLLPIVAAAVGPLLLYLQVTLVGCLLVLLLDRVSAAGRRHTASVMAASLAVGVTLAGLVGIDRIDIWLGKGLLLGLLLFLGHRYLFRYDLSTLPLSAATLFSLACLGEAIAAPYPGARVGSLLAMTLVLAAGWIWSRRWAEPLDPAAR